MGVAAILSATFNSWILCIQNYIVDAWSDVEMSCMLWVEGGNDY